MCACAGRGRLPRAHHHRGLRAIAKMPGRGNREKGRHPAHHQEHRLGRFVAGRDQIMSRKRIVFQGEPGANSHLAISQAYPDAEAVPCNTFEDAFTALSAGDADLGMIPIENSVAGRVADIHHLMPNSKLHIIAEHFMPVSHQMLGVKGAKLEDIKTVESHVHALGQCRKIIRKLGIKPIVAADTAGSAREIAERGDKTCAAIATRLPEKSTASTSWPRMSRTRR